MTGQPDDERDIEAADQGRYEAHLPVSDEALRPIAAELSALAPGARAFKTAIAVGLAWWLGNLLGEPRPMFAALGALVAVEPTIVASLRRTGLQLVGIVGGTALAWVISAFAETQAVLIGLMVLAGLWLGRLLRSPDRVGVELSVTALLVVVLGKGEVSYGFFRLWEIALGGLVAATVNALILPPNYVDRVISGMDSLVEQLSAGLADAVRIFVEVPNHEGAADVRPVVRAARATIQQIEADLRLAEQAMLLSPLVRSSAPTLARAKKALPLYIHAGSHAARVARVVEGHAQRPHSWEHGRIESPAYLQVATVSLAGAMSSYQSYVRYGDPAPLGDARRDLEAARDALSKFFAAAERDRATTSMERLVDVAAIASELDHLAADAEKALAAKP